MDAFVRQLRGRSLIRAIIFCLGVGAAWSPLPCQAADLRNELAVLAKDVAKLLKAPNRNFESIAVGQFTGPPGASSGPGIAQMLSEELQKQGLQVRPTALVGINGSFQLSDAERHDPVSGKDKKVAVVKIRGTVVDRLGAVLTSFNLNSVAKGEFEKVVTDESQVVQLLSVPVALSPDEDEFQRSEKLRQKTAQPSVHVEKGAVVLPEPDSPFGVEVLVEGQPCPVQVQDGFACVDLDRDQVYAVRIHNRSHHEAAVKVLIDGLSTFTFSEVRHVSGPKQGDPRYTHYILAPHSSALVQGWHRTNDEVDSFLVTEYAKSAAATLKHHEGVGVITVSFAAAWSDDSKKPPDEPDLAQKGVGDATGFGPRIAAKAEEVRREIGVLRANVSIQYAKPQS